MRAQEFKEETYLDLLQKLALQGKRTDFSLEVANALDALRTGRALHTPNISTPQQQLLWAITLSYLQKNLTEFQKKWSEPAAKAKELTDLPLWKQITESYTAQDEMAEVASRIAREIRNRDVTIDWGPPGSWFFYNTLENHINLDMVMALTEGFEHARSTSAHELFHSQFTVRFTDRMHELIQELKPYEKKINEKKKLTPQEYLKMHTLQVELKWRHALWDKVENCCVNRAAANSSHTHYQDYYYSLNHTILTTSGYGKRYQESMAKVVSSEDSDASEVFNEAAKKPSPAEMRFALI